MAGGATADGLAYLAELWSYGEEPVGSYYVALIRTIPPTFAADGDNLDEPDSAAYVRAELVNDSANWAVNNGTVANVFEVAFPPCDVTWGRIGYWAICDEEEGGRVFFVGQLEEPLYVEATGVVVLTPGAVGVEMTGTQWLMQSV